MLRGSLRGATLTLVALTLAACDTPFNLGTSGDGNGLDSAGRATTGTISASSGASAGGGAGTSGTTSTAGGTNASGGVGGGTGTGTAGEGEGGTSGSGGSAGQAGNDDTGGEPNLGSGGSTGGTSGGSGGEPSGGGGSGTAGGGSGGQAGSGGAGGSGGTGGSGGLPNTTDDWETQMLDAHNAARARVDAAPALDDLLWSDDAALLAQDWADELAAECNSAATDFQIYHRPNNDSYGENIATYLSRPTPPESTPEDAVAGWEAEGMCWTFGAISGGSGGGNEECDLECFAENDINSPGCGHYTQLAWRETTHVGCGVAYCEGPSGGTDWNWDIWVCNYDPPGNYIGQEPY